MSDSSMDEGDLFPLHDDSDEDEHPRKRRRTTKIVRDRAPAFVKSTHDEEEEDEMFRPAFGRSTEDGEPRDTLRSSFRIGEYNETITPAMETEEEEAPRSPEPVVRPSAFDNRGGAAANSFAAKMMAKMGYKEGQGLGAKGQGISAPIQVTRLQAKAGLGTGSSNEDAPRKRPDKRKVKTQGLPSVPKAPPKPKFITAEARGLAVPTTLRSIIIDATGKEARTLSSATGLLTPTRSGSPEVESVKIARRAKRDLESFAEAWNAQEDFKARLNDQKVQTGEDIERQQTAINRLQSLVQTMEAIQLEAYSSANVTDLETQWAETVTRLEGLQVMYVDEIDEMGLSAAAVATLEPLFKRQMLEWDPLTDPRSVVSSLQKLRTILDIDHEPRKGDPSTYYESMIRQNWLSKVQSVLTNEWDVYNPDGAITLFESWQPVLPAWIQTKIMNDLVVNRLANAIKVWRSSHPPMYSWIFPWLPLLSSEDRDAKQSQSIFGLVKRKVNTEEWPHWKPLFGEKRRAAIAPAIPVVLESEKKPQQYDEPEMSFREQVEEWCADEELIMKRVQGQSVSEQPRYRLQGANAKGIVVFLQGDVVWITGTGEPQPSGLDDGLANLARR